MSPAIMLMVRGKGTTGNEQTDQKPSNMSNLQEKAYEFTGWFHGAFLCTR